MAASARDLVGRLLAGGRYAVRAPLGEGGMGYVYRAHDRHLDAEVVIKMPRRALLEDPEFAGRFTREVRALVDLAHPHVVKILDVGEHEGLPFAVMHYLSGGSLADRRPAGPPERVEPRATAAWLPGIAQALDFVHQSGFLHRDVKPANLLFDARGHAYLGDFGIAKALWAEAGASRGATLTATGMVLGTPEYMAPELILGHPADGRADQYALAVTVYEMLAGRRPFEGPNPTAIIVQQSTAEPPRLDAICPAVPGSVADAVHRALAKDPARRYSSCSAFARAVLKAWEGGGRPARRPDPAPSPQEEGLPADLRLVSAEERGARRAHTHAALLGAAIAGAILVGLVGLAVAILPSRPAATRPGPWERAEAPIIPVVPRKPLADLTPRLAPPPAANPAKRPEAVVKAEDPLAAAGAAIDRGDLTAARRLLVLARNRLAGPEAIRASRMIDEIDLARSVTKARQFLKDLSDVDLDALAEGRAIPGADRVRHPALKARYAETLQGQVDFERNRRLLARRPAIVPPVEPPQAGGIVRVPIDEVITNPAKFEGRTVIPNGTVRIATKLSRRTDGRYDLRMADEVMAIQRAERLAGKPSTDFVVEPAPAGRFLDYVRQNAEKPDLSPEWHAILTLRVERVPDGDGERWIAIVSKIEMLIRWNLAAIALGNLRNAFLVLKIDELSAEEWTADGVLWAELLGKKWIDRQKEEFLRRQRRARQQAARKQGAAIINQGIVNGVQRNNEELNRQRNAAMRGGFLPGG